MAAKRRVVTPRVFSDQELEIVARELIERASGLSRSDFKKELLPDHKKVDKLVLEAANQLAARREIYRWSSARKLRFFAGDPFDALALSVAAALADGPLSEAELKSRVDASQRGFGDLVKEWLKGALARGDMYVHLPRKGSKLKRYGSTPDVAGLLKKVLMELKKVLSTPAGQNVRKAQFLESIAAELDTPLPRAPEPEECTQVQFLARLCELALAAKTDGLLSIRELRAHLPFDKQQFDHIALELARKNVVTMHHHDFPASLAASDRDEFVVDAHGNYFVGIALRRTQ